MIRFVTTIEYMSYSEREPTLPYNVEEFDDWAERNDVNAELFDGLIGPGGIAYSGNRDPFLIAKLRSRELSAEAQLRLEVEATLPLRGAQLVESPIQTYVLRETDDADIINNPLAILGSNVEPERLPKEYLAPKGMAFKITIQPEVFAWQYDEDERKDLQPFSYIGEYLQITTLTYDGKPHARIQVRGDVKANLAHAILGAGNFFGGPAEEDLIRLSSPTDPNRNGPGVAFIRHSEPTVTIRSKEHEAPFGLCEVELVSYEKPTENAFYNPPRPTNPEELKLDDFVYFPEEEPVPHGFIRVPIAGGGTTVFRHPTSFMALPHIDDSLREKFWKQHHIMLKWTSAASHPRLDLYLDRLNGVDYQIRRYNSLIARNYMFQRYFAVHDPGTGISLTSLVNAMLRKEYLTLDEIENGPGMRRL